MTRENYGSLVRLLQNLRRIDPEFPIQYALCLVEIAQAEGLSLTDLARRTGICLSTISRIVTALSGTRSPAGGLVKVNFSPQELRRKEIYLTPQGATLVRQLLRSLEQRSAA